MRIIRNLIKYTLGLPLLLVLTVVISVAYGINLIFSVILDGWVLDEWFEDLEYIWKPLK